MTPEPEPIVTPPSPPAPPAPPIAEPPKDHFSKRLGGEISNHPGLQKFGSETDLAKSYLELEKKLSAGGVRVPGEKASQEEITAYHKAIGVPDSIEGYDFKTEVQIPDGIGWNDEFQNDMLASMKTAGLSKAQVKAVSQAFIDRQASLYGQATRVATEVRAESEKYLRGRWGSSYDGKIRGANLAMAHLFGDNMKRMATTQLADGTMLGVHPAFVEAMATIGDDYAEHNLHGIGDRRRLTLTPEEAGAELAKLQGDAAFQKALFQKDDPGHAAAQSRRNDLYAMKSAGG